MSIKKPQILKGFRDLLPEEALAKKNLINVLVGEFELFGFTPIETPHIEYTELLIEESQGEIEKQLYRFEDNGGRDVLLRFDLTVPLARYVVQNQNDLVFPFKRYAVGNVFRAEKPQFGRFREFTQCDIDFIGTDSLLAEAEVLQIIASALKALNISDFKVRINNRKLMNAISATYNFSDKIQDVLRTVDKIDKIGRDKVVEELVALSISKDQVDKILAFLDVGRGSPKEIVAKLKELEIESDDFKSAIDELSELASYLEANSKNFEYDVSIARGLGYYTGIVYETNLDNLPELGSVCSGGRYDNLTQNFSKQKMSGVGASFGLDRLITGLIKLGDLKLKKSTAKVMCAQVSSDTASDILNVAAKLREKCIPIEVYPQFSKLKKQIQYAEKKEIPFMVIIGEDEKEKGVITLKDLEGREQFECKDVEELIQKLNL